MKHKDKHHFALITGLRLLLWWGAEAAKTLFAYRKPNTQVRHISRLDTELPLAKWIIASKKVYCLASEKNKKQVIIRVAGSISNN